MNTTCEQFCQRLVELIKKSKRIGRYSEILNEYPNLTKNDIHIIETIGKKEGESMSSVASMLDITVGSLSVAINTLVKKGYVTRVRSEEDRRVVRVKLTELGLDVYEKDFQYHYSLLDELLELYTKEQIETLSECGKILMDYLENDNK